MVSQQLGQFSFFLEHLSWSLFYITFVAISPSTLASFFSICIFIRSSGWTHNSCYIIFLPLILLPLVSRMIDSKDTTHHCCTSQIVNREIRTSLIFVFEKSEPFAFAGIFVAHEVDVDWLAVLGKDSHDITFGEIER